MKRCPSCGLARGTRRTGWTPIVQDGLEVGFVCPACPRWDEPIRREVLKDGRVRFLAVVVVRVDRAKRLQRKRRFDQLDEARAWVDETRDGLRKSSDFTDPASITVRMMCERWLENKMLETVTGELRVVSLNGYASSLNGVLMHLGDRLIRECSTDDVEVCLRKLATTGGKWGRPLAHRSLVYGLGSLRQAFAYAKRQKWISENPATDAKAPGTTRKATTGRVTRWDMTQMKTFKGAVNGQHEAWVQVGMTLSLSGLRRSEVLGLDWSAVDMMTGAVEVRQSRVKTGRSVDTSLGAPKTENSHRVVEVEKIHPGFITALKALWLQQGRPAEGLVIVDALGPVHPDRYSTRFNALCDEAGVPRLTRVHNVRHSLAIALQSSGVPDQQAAALLGHDVATYRRFYLVTDDEGASAAAEKAGQLFAV